jgi:hypothetical protein
MLNQREDRLIGAVVFGLLTVLSNPGASAAYNVEVVQTTERGIATYTALSYNSTGEPTIAYGDGAAGEVRLASKNGGSWSTETVDSRDLVSVVKHTHSSGGTPAVTYITSDGGGFSLFYADKVSGSWSTKRIVRRINSGVNALAFDGSDAPSVVYDKSQRLIFAHRPGGSWDDEVVASNVNTGAVSLAYDGSGNPTIAFIDDQRSTAGTTFLKFASKSGSSWTIETVSTSTVNIKGPALVYDPSNGEPTILYSLAASSLTRHARKSGGVWQIEDVVCTSSASLDFDASGNAFVAYRNCTGNNQLLVANRTSGSWSSEVVDSSTVDSAFSVPSLRIDGSGNPSLSYAKRAGIGAPRDLRFAGIGTGCVESADCDDVNECTDDLCVAGSCQNTIVADDTACDLGSGICCSGTCRAPVCVGDEDCNDSDICTDDTCYDPNVCSAYCEHVFNAANDPSCDVCVPTHEKEKGPRCNDGLDNDCDGLIDGDDPDC